jgi:hypothetical protein
MKSTTTHVRNLPEVKSARSADHPTGGTRKMTSSRKQDRSGCSQPIKGETQVVRPGIRPLPWSPTTEGHAMHLISCMRDSYGLPKHSDFDSLITGLGNRLEELATMAPLEKILKWFYGASLSVITGGDITPPPQSDNVLFIRLIALCRGPRHRRYKIVRTLFNEKFGRHVGAKFLKYQRRYQDGTWSQRFEALSFGQTFLIMKQGSPVVSEALMTETAEKHREALKDQSRGLHSRARGKVYGQSSEDSSVSATGADQALDRAIRRDDKLIIEIEKTVQEIFGKRKFKAKGGLAIFPSINGHFSTKSKEGGAAMRVVDSWVRAAQTPGAPPLSVTVTYEDGRTEAFDHLENHSESFRQEICYALEDERMMGSPAVAIQILEPLKVRTVTCGPEFSYWLLMDVQKFMWRVCKSHPTFELIGTTITSDVVDSLLSWPTGSFLSGDYSRATDCLRKCLSDAAWDKICDVTGIPEWLRALGRQCLTEHTMYPHRDPIKSSTPDFYEALAGIGEKQENGQLMGSPLSFPILCIVNAAICRMSFEKKSRKMSLRKLPIKINGDDCGMRYMESEKTRWEKYADAAGLTPSPGKCYFSDEFIQLNSELFFLKNGRFVNVPFWRFGLTKIKASKGDEERTYAALGSLATKFVFGRYPDNYSTGLSGEELWLKRDRAISIFLGRQAKLLAMAPRQISWFLPTQYGGLGIPNRKRVIKDHLTVDQRKLASFLHEKMVRGEQPESPFGRWTQDMHPWLKAALQRTSDYESKKVVFEDDFSELTAASWADLDESDTYWDVTKRLDVFGPVLWAYASKVSFSEASRIAQRLDKSKTQQIKIKRVRGLNQKMGKKVVGELRDTPRRNAGVKEKCACLSKKWSKLMGESLKATTCSYSLRDFLRPRHIESKIIEKDIERLRAFVPGPRDILATLLVPTPLPSYVEVLKSNLFTSISKTGLSLETLEQMTALRRLTIDIGDVCKLIASGGVACVN